MRSYWTVCVPCPQLGLQPQDRFYRELLGFALVAACLLGEQPREGLGSEDPNGKERIMRSSLVGVGGLFVLGGVLLCRGFLVG